MKRKQTKEISPPAVPAKPSVQTGLLIELFAVLILAGIPFALGKYFEFSQPDPFDGGAYAYSAWHVYQGAKLGSEEIISAQPATFLMNYIGVAMFGYSELGPEIVQMTLQLVSLVLMFYSLRQCFGKTAAILCAALASIYLSAPLIAKFGNVKEQFMIAFMVITACFVLLMLKTKKDWLWAVVGAFAIWPHYFKPTGLSIPAATGICIVLFSLPARSWIAFLNRLLLLSGGALAGISPMLLFFYWKTGRPLFFQTFPLLLIRMTIALAVFGYVILALSWINRRLGLFARLRKVHWTYWAAGAGAILAVHIIGSIIVRIQTGAIGEDIWNYLYATPFFESSQYLDSRIQFYIKQTWKSLGTSDVYLTGSRAMMGFSQQAPMVLRYYALLKLPIFLSVASILVLAVRSFLRVTRKINELKPQDWMAVFLGLWWIFDMGMIWVSPRSYEQYYLPMCASAAMLGGYGIWLFMERLNPVRSLAGKILAPAALLAMTGMIWPIFAGITHSPFSGQAYGQRSRGYAQSWAEIREKLREKAVAPWEQLSDYIRTHSAPEDRMYVWGWYPGMYVRAQRLSASPQATESNMHIVTPPYLAGIVNRLLNAFDQSPPKFIVDTRKREFPWNIPPLELWPQKPYVPNELQDKNGFLSRDPLKIQQFDIGYPAMLSKQVSPEEAKRFEAMKPFRDYVMQHYKVAGVFGMHILFERINPAGKP